MTTVVALWIVAGCIAGLVVALGYAWWDAKRHPARWLSLPSLDEREDESRHT